MTGAPALGLLAIFAAAAASMGRSLARNWRPAWQVGAYALLLAAGERFLSYALFAGTLLSAGGYAASLAVLAAVGAAAYRSAQAGRMVAQYPWLYERAGPFAWRARAPTPRPASTEF